MQSYTIVVTFLPLLSVIGCKANCNIKIGEQITGEQLLHNITISKGPLDVEQIIEMELDYRVSPLQNEEISYVQLVGTGPGCSAIISNSVDRKKQLLGTVSSTTQLREFSVKLSVYGFLRINGK
ncbi:uncharacterized protein LOC128717946 [Anopheles marshallii]|uniref:uncharacterized protein LOC128717946 n=1 Tax=Anopheles marshallii TaxID=1521116 RepID=UPI00237AA6CB|nr:uncharacterized protein LOC128717946 [Anopheles marshallii]